MSPTDGNSPARGDSAQIRSRIASLEAELAALREELAKAEPPPPPPLPLIPPRAPGSPQGADALERFVGGRVIATIGGIVLTVALGALIHLGYRQGWFSHFGPLGRMIVGDIVSAAVLIIGEVLLRRVGRLAAVGCTSAGIAGLFISTYVGAESSAAIEPAATLGIATAIALLGAFLTLRLASLPVAIIAMLGAYAAPAFADGYRQAPFFTAVHLSVAFGVTLAIAAIRPRPFWVLRFVSLPIHGFAALIWLFSRAWLEPAMTLSFVIVWWAAYLGEAGLAALRGTTPRANVVSAFLATLLATGFIAPVLGETIPWQNLLAYAPIAMALGAAVASFLLPQVHLDDAISDDERLLARSASLYRSALRLIAGLLAALALAPFLGAAALAVAWAAFAVAACECDRTPERPILVGGRALGMVVLLLAMVAAMVSAVVTGMRGAGWFTLGSGAIVSGLGSLSIGPSSMAFLAVGIAGAIIARRLTERQPAVGLAAGLLGMVAWVLFSAGSGEEWMRALLMTLGPTAFAYARRGWLPIVTLFGSSIAMLVWGAMKLDRIGGLAPIASFGIDVLIAAIAVGAAFVASLGAERPRLRIALVVWTTLLVSAAVAIIGWADVGGTLRASASDAIGVACACVGVAAMIIQLYANGFGARPLAIASVAQLGFATVLWAVGAVALPAIEQPVDVAAPFLHLGTGIAIVLIATTVLAARSERRVEPTGLAAIFLGGLVAFELLVYLSREAARLVAAFDPKLVAPSMSLLWGATAIAAIVVGFARKNAPARWVGLLVLGGVAAKVLLWDMRETDTIVRVVIMLAVGAIMVVTSVLYVRRGLGSDRKEAAPLAPPVPPVPPPGQEPEGPRA